MSDAFSTYTLAAGMGAVAGMRSMAVPALLSRSLPRQGPGGRLLASRAGKTALTVCAAGEMAFDKTPWAPDRTQPLALAGRALAGAVSGAAIASARGRSQLGAALIGASSAIGGTYLAYGLRKQARERLGIPNVVLGFLEDTAVYAIGSRLAAAVK